MKTVLLTGATGYVGQYAIGPLLDRGYVVHAVSSKPAIEESTENLIWHQADLLDPHQVTGLVGEVRPTHLLHFAWYVEHGKFWNAPENIDWVRASLQLMREFAANGGQRIVMAGTCAEYDWRVPQESFSETESPADPQTLYGVSKHALHLILQKYAEELGISHAWGQIFFLFGGAEPAQRFIPYVIKCLLKGWEAKTSHGNQVRDFMFVGDAGEAFASLLDSDVSGAVNIASGTPTPLRRIAEMLADITGRPELLRLGALPSQEGEPAILAADTKRLEVEVGFHARTDLRPALEKTVEWWRVRL